MTFSRRYEEAEPQRVNRWLAQSGVCSRREAEGLIADDRVRIDGEVVADAGRKILPGQTLTIDQEASTAPMTLLVHKPVGVVSAHPEPGQKQASQLLTPQRLWGPPPATLPSPTDSIPPIGRLDRDSRGLLLLSQDGVVAKAVIGPESEMTKAYEVRIRGSVTPAKLERLRHGLTLDGRRLRRAEVEDLGDGRLSFVLGEGRNRQIRRMCELVDLRVIDLLRTRIGPLELGELPEGRWRPVTAEERAALVG